MYVCMYVQDERMEPEEADDASVAKPITLEAVAMNMTHTYQFTHNGTPTGVPLRFQ